MNLRAVANSYTQAVNPNVAATIRRSTGYTTGAGARRVPTYADPQAIVVQQQALSTKQLEHLDSLNIQGTLSAFWLNGAAHAVDRRDQTGGDLLVVQGVTWLVVAVLEEWVQSGWAHVVGQKQLDA